MKATFFATAGALCGLVMAANAMAQDASTSTTQTAYYETTSFALHDESGTTSGSASGETTSEGTASKDDEKPTSRWCYDGKCGDPWTLPQPKCLSSHNITVGGYLSGGIYSNQWGAASNGPLGFNNVGDGATFNQFDFFAERKINTEDGKFDIGGRVDYMFGADAQDVQCFGDHSFDYGWNTSRDYGSAMPQLYTEVGYDKLSAKIGRFWTPIGYEVSPATGNFFYSHSYSFSYGEPITHTGVLTQYKMNDKITVYNGWVDGWDSGFDDDNSGSMYLGGIALTLSEKATFSWYCSAGDFGNGTAYAGAMSGNLYENNFVFNYKLNDKWTYGFAHDLGSNYDLANGGEDNQWYGLTNYLFYKVNDCLSYGGRFEWFQDPQGARIANGAAGNYYELTAGFNWKPHANIMIRPEIRYDWYEGFANATALPFNDGTATTQLSGGFDAIFTF
jgi:hypothetical protein